MNNKKVKKRLIFVLLALLITVICGYVMYRGAYLETFEIGEEYLLGFYRKIEYVGITYLANFILIYFAIYITTTKVKKGAKVFFEQEKKEMPKLPRKSIAFIGSIISSIFATKVLVHKVVLFLGTAYFEKKAPIFGYDIGYYIFQKPFIESCLYYLLVLTVALLVYAVIYYIIIFNTYFEGIEKETLKKSNFIKQITGKVLIISILIGGLIFVKTQDIGLQKFISIKEGELDYSLYGAGLLDATVKLWGYRILSALVVVVIFLGVKFLKKQDTKKVIRTIIVIPAYLLVMFIILIGGNLIYVKPNELDREKEYIEYNIGATKTAYGIDVEEVSLDNGGTITKQLVDNNSNVINNINLVSKEVLLKDLNGSQTSKKYYYYNNTKIGRYDIDGQSNLVYVSPREMVENEKTRTYNNKTYEYTHGFGVILTSATSVNKNGNLQTIQKGFEQQEAIKIEQPRIYYGINTNNTVVVNNQEKEEFDYPITNSKTVKNAVNSYEGKAGLTLNLLDRMILSIREKNIKLAFSGNVDKESKILINRNIIERAKTIMPDLVYDENPYMILTDEGKMIWVLDAYTVSNNYPYSQKMFIEVAGERKEINYIRNSVKVLIDCYDGNVSFYITDRTDPIVMAYNNIYPGIFENIEQSIPEQVSKHFVYPEFLYKIQAKVIEKYHNVGPEVLYRSDDLWQAATQNTGKSATKVGTDIEPYYTMMKVSNEDENLGLILPYTPYAKQNIISYLVGSYNKEGKQTLKIYKFSEDSNVLGPIQLDTQIEQNDTIANEIESLDTTGVKLIKNMVIVPIENTLLYIEPIYQVYTNETNALPTLRRVIVASGNKIAIGDSLAQALESLVSQYAVDIEVENTDNIEDLIETIIKANSNLETSTDNKDWGMIGKDITRLQNLITRLEELRK
ncbi:MAG: UPF0182 family protein, partial [Clostridia bacterium]|nr:UPF0182 family protein [Clostridia bacterium]